MSRMKINCGKLNNLGSDLEKNIIDFEKDRLLFLKELDNLQDCWYGVDQNVFQTKSLDYLKDLKYDVDFLYEWSRYLQSTSRMYRYVEEDGLKKVRNSFDSFDIRR